MDRATRIRSTGGSARDLIVIYPFTFYIIIIWFTIIIWVQIISIIGGQVAWRCWSVNRGVVTRSRRGVWKTIRVGSIGMG
jgi:hypothetical protein